MSAELKKQQHRNTELNSYNFLLSKNIKSLNQHVDAEINLHDQQCVKKYHLWCNVKDIYVLCVKDVRWS